MLFRILKDLAFSFLLCVGERILERILLPGMHLSIAQSVTDDPARAAGMSLLIAEALALMGMIWVFTGSLYVIGWLYRRPLRWQVPPLIAIMICTLTFVSSLANWSQRPSPPPSVSTSAAP